MGPRAGEGTVKTNLPDAHADFILAVAGEEFGLIVCLVIVAIFAFVVLRGFANLMRTTDLFVVIASTGLLVQFALQALINMGSTVSLMPTKGMTLPFISYGGSSLLALAFGMGILLAALTRIRAGVTAYDRNVSPCCFGGRRHRRSRFPSALAMELLARGYSLVLVADSRSEAFDGALGELDVHRIDAPAGSQAADMEEIDCVPSSWAWLLAGPPLAMDRLNPLGYVVGLEQLPVGTDRA